MGQLSISSWLTAQPRPGAVICPRDTSHLRPVPSGSTPTPSEAPTDKALPSTSLPASKAPIALDPAAPVSVATKTLDSRASIVPCSSQHIKAFRRLTSLLLPIPYPDSFYKETVNDPIIASLTRILLWREAEPTTPGSNEFEAGDTNDWQLVAGIRCRLLASPPNDPADQTTVLYISTLATLSAFRDQGLASALLTDVMVRAAQQYGVTAVMAHVWEGNQEALAWYKRRNFRIVGKDNTYYRRLAPQTSAYIIRRDLRPTDLIGQGFKRAG